MNPSSERGFIRAHQEFLTPPNDLIGDEEDTELEIKCLKCGQMFVVKKDTYLPDDCPDCRTKAC